MSSKKKTTTHQEVAPTNPEWVTDNVQGLSGDISKLGQADPYSFVAGPDGLQTQASQGASGLSTPGAFGQAQGIYGNVAGAGANTYAPTTGKATLGNSASLLDNLSSYMSPYTNDVVNSSLADYDYGAGQAKTAQDADLARSGAFGGSRAAIGQSMLADSLSRGRGTLSAGLRDQAFQTGASLSGQDAARRQEMELANTGAQNQFGLANMNALNTAGQFNAGQMDNSLARQLAAASGMSTNASAMGANDRANIGLQGDLGAQLQALAQQRAAAPLNLLSARTAMTGSLPYNLYNGQITDATTTSKTSGLGNALSSVGSLAMGLGAMGFAPLTGGGSLAALGAMSDRRLKRDIVKLGDREDGLGVYLYRYLWSPMQFIGVMAQEVLGVKPEAVFTTQSGYLAVDYGKL